MSDVYLIEFGASSVPCVIIVLHLLV